jgi:hypothetical protein
VVILWSVSAAHEWSWMVVHVIGHSQLVVVVVVMCVCACVCVCLCVCVCVSVCVCVCVCVRSASELRRRHGTPLDS